MVNYIDVSKLGKQSTIFIPPMHYITARFMAAIFRGLGFRSEVLKEDRQTLDLGMRHTAGGECVPCPSTLGAMMAALERTGVAPADAVFFMPTTCGPCRFGQYATFASMAFQKKGWHQVKVLGFNSENSYGGFRGITRKLLWHALVLGDVIHKLLLKLRPYEKAAGDVEGVAEAWIRRLEEDFEKPRPNLAGLLAGLVKEIQGVPLRRETRPGVAVVGEIYIRSDPFINNDLIREIERLGGEVLASTVGEWVLYCSEIERRKRRQHPRFRRNRLVLFAERKWFAAIEHKYMRVAHEILHDRQEPAISAVMAEGEKHLPWQFQSEAILTVGRAVRFIKENGVRAVVNASPMFCMPGTICAAIFQDIERTYGVPVISNFYDGYADPNKSLAPYMHFLREGDEKEAVQEGGDPPHPS